MKTKLDVIQTFVDRCIEEVLAGELTAEEAAEAKLWVTETEWEVTGPLPAAARRLRLHQRVRDRPLWRDGRVQRIYGGTSEIMKEIIGRSMGF